MSNSLLFQSRRSPLYTVGGCVSSSQPLASLAGSTILQQGGNAVDACVAMAAALNVTEPTSTGIGGDMFCLVWKDGKVHAVNGSGRSAKKGDIQLIKQRNGSADGIPMDSPDSITVPGAIKGWLDSLSTFGTLPPETILAPAISLARDGFPVGPISQQMWSDAADRLRKQAKGTEWQEWMVWDGNWKAPGVAQVFKIPTLAKAFENLALPNATASDSPFMKPIIETLASHSSLLDADDFASHKTTFTESIHFDYHDWRIHQHGPNGHGITVLLTLAIIMHLEKTGIITPLSQMEPYSTEWTHTLVECCKIAFADTEHYITDPEFMKDVTYSDLLSPSHVAKRAALFSPNAAQHWQFHGPGLNSDTVYLCAIDSNGMACSFINSLYKPFGSAIICPGTGIILQNRGTNFSLDPTHPNCYDGGKRPFHTILPGMITSHSGELIATIGCMGGFMQPQGQVQIITSLYHHPTRTSPQADIDAGRFMIPFDEEGENVLFLEDSVPTITVNGLIAKGHNVKILSGWDRERFGRAQVILSKNKVLIAGSDGRGDGCPIPAPLTDLKIS